VFLALVADVDFGPFLADENLPRRALLGLIINVAIGAVAFVARSIDVGGAVSAVLSHACRRADPSPIVVEEWTANTETFAVIAIIDSVVRRQHSRPRGHECKSSVYFKSTV